MVIFHPVNPEPIVQDYRADSKQINAIRNKRATTPTNVSVSETQAGTYKTETINGKTYTSFVPSGTTITNPSGGWSISGKGTGGRQFTTINGQKLELAQTPTTETTTTTANIATLPGRRTTQPVPVSYGVYQQVTNLGRYEAEKQFLGGIPQAKKNQIYSIQLEKPNSLTITKDLTQTKISSIFTIPKKEKTTTTKKEGWYSGFLESQATLLNKWEKGSFKRTENVNKLFTNLIQKSPFRQQKPLNWIEQVGSKGLSAPTQLSLGFIEGLGVTVGKAGFFYQAYAYGRITRNEQRQNLIKQQFTSATYLLPSALATSYNPKTPEGFTNILTTISAPSFIQKSITTTRGLSFVSKTKLDISQAVEPKVLSGQQRFPKSYATPLSLKNEFFTSQFLKTPKQILLESGTTKILGGFSASPKPISTYFGTRWGESASPGIYIDRSLSVYFTKIKGESGKVSFGILPSIKRPTVQYLSVEKVNLIPESFIKKAEIKSGINIGMGGTKSVSGNPVWINQRYTSFGKIALKELNKYFLTPTKNINRPGTATISPEFYLGKSEPEALVNAMLKVKRPGYSWFDTLTGFKYFYEYKGEKIPLRFIEATPEVQKPTSFSKLTSDFTKSEILKSSERSFSKKITPFEFSSSSRTFKTSSYSITSIKSSSSTTQNSRITSSQYRTSNYNYNYRPSSSSYSSLISIPSYTSPRTSLPNYMSSRASIPSYSPPRSSIKITYSKTPSKISPLTFPKTLYKLPSNMKKNKTIKKKKNKTYTTKLNYDVFVLPDLRSVFITEQQTGKEAIAPRLKGNVLSLASRAFKGYGTGFIPTEQIRLKKVKT